MRAVSVLVLATLVSAAAAAQPERGAVYCPAGVCPRLDAEGGIAGPRGERLEAAVAEVRASVRDRSRPPVRMRPRRSEHRLAETLAVPMTSGRRDTLGTDVLVLHRDTSGVIRRARYRVGAASQRPDRVRPEPTLESVLDDDGLTSIHVVYRDSSGRETRDVEALRERVRCTPSLGRPRPEDCPRSTYASTVLDHHFDANGRTVWVTWTHRLALPKGCPAVGMALHETVVLDPDGRLLDRMTGTEPSGLVGPECPRPSPGEPPMKTYPTADALLDDLGLSSADALTWTPTRRVVVPAPPRR